MSSGELIGRGPRDWSDICACIIGVGGCGCGVDGNVRPGVTERPGEDEPGGGEKVLVGGGGDRGVYAAFWSRPK